MKKYFLILVLLLQLIDSKSQATRFAVVKPNGTTYIFSTLDSSYNAATNGDAIYLPGGVYTFPNNTINKKLFIYGAGCYQDSSLITNATIINNPIHINDGASGGVISGCYIQGTITVDDSINNYTIKYCYIDGGIQFNSNCSNSIIRDNILGIHTYWPEPYLTYHSSLNLLGSNNLIANNVFFGSVSSNGGNIYRNNIFNHVGGIGYYGIVTANNTTNNEIFFDNVFAMAQFSIYNYTFCTNSTFNNNLNVGNGYMGSNNWGGNNQDPAINFNTLFTSFVAAFASFHFSATAPSYVNNMASDSGPVGIYGGIYPVNEGWVPENPHIFYKNVAPQSNNNGKLPIHFKVRNGN